MSDEPILREKACNAVLSGKLSGRSPDRTWGGPGVGAICSVCELPVTKEEKEFEIQFAHRIIDYNGEMVEESYTGFPTIAAAVADGNERLRRHAEREAPVRPRRAR